MSPISIIKITNLPNISCVCCICYVLFLLWFRCQSSETICHILKKLDSFHTCQIPHDASHVDDCSPSIKAINTVADRFAIAHLSGYIVKGMLFPHRKSLWMLSFGFEFIERLLASKIVWFRECWWDSLIFDILLCNGLGIEIGLIMSTPLPNHLVENTFRLCIITICVMIMDLNSFLIRHQFQLSASSPIHFYRMVLLLLLLLPLRSALKSRVIPKRISFIIISVLITEVLISI